MSRRTLLNKYNDETRVLESHLFELFLVDCAQTIARGWYSLLLLYITITYCITMPKIERGNELEEESKKEL